MESLAEKRRANRREGRDYWERLRQPVRDWTVWLCTECAWNLSQPVFPDNSGNYRNFREIQPRGLQFPPEYRQFGRERVTFGPKINRHVSGGEQGGIRSACGWDLGREARCARSPGSHKQGEFGFDQCPTLFGHYNDHQLFEPCTATSIKVSQMHA